MKKIWFYFLILPIGADESSGYKDINFKPNGFFKTTSDQTDETEASPPPSKKKKDCDCDSEKKETKSLYSTQVAPVQLQARLPDQTVEVLYENPHVNSIFGHQPWRQAYEKGLFTNYVNMILGILPHPLT